MCGLCLTDWLNKEVELNTTHKAHCPACGSSILSAEGRSQPLPVFVQPEEPSDSVLTAHRVSAHLSTTRRYRYRALPAPPVLPNPRPRPARLQPEPAPNVAQVPQRAEHHDELLLSLDEAYASNRLWQFIPETSKSRWIDACRPCLAGYSKARLQKDTRAMTDWLSAFLLLPQQCLGKPHRGTTSRETKRLANQLKFVINAQRAADERDAADQLDNARHNAASAAARAPRRAPPIDPDDAQDRRMRHKIELSNSLVKRGFLSRGCKQLSAGKICPPTPETLQRLKALHPAAPAGRQLPAPPANAPVIVVEPELLAAILKKHIVNGAAPGCSGLSGELLAPLVEDPTCLSGLAGIVEDICNNDLGEHARQLLLQSKLLAFVKPDSDKPRPIAIGEVLYKLATAYGLEMANQKPAHGNPGDDGVSSVLRAVFDVIQLGIGVPGGAELAFHILQARLETIGPNGAALLADIENAFNSRDRAVMLEELYAEPRLMFLWNLAAFGYGGNATSLVYLVGDTPHRIPSAEGSRQGCLLGTLLFCLSVQREFKAAVQNLDVTARAICDDFNAVGPYSVCLETYDRLLRSTLRLNCSKTKILWPHDSDPPADLVQGCTVRGIQLVRRSAKLLGTALGFDPGAVTQLAQTHADSHDVLFKAIRHPSMLKQVGALLLRTCLQPCMGYPTRVCKPDHIEAPCQSFDAKVALAFQHLAGLEPNEPSEPHAERDAKLSPLLSAALKTLIKPIRQGGFGIRTSVDLRHPAYWSASVQAATDVLPFIPADPVLADAVGFVAARNAAYSRLVARGAKVQPPEILGSPGKYPRFPEPDEPAPILLPRCPAEIQPFYASVRDDKTFKLQKFLTRSIEDLTYAVDFNAASKEEQFRILDVRGYGASAWLLALPTSSYKRICDSHFSLALRYRFGIPIASGITHCGACLNPIRNTVATHYNSCIKYRRTTVTSRHDALAKHSVRIGERAGAVAVWEPPPDRGVRKRPDASFFFSTHTAYTDTTVRDPTNNTALRRVAPKAGAVLDDAVTQKNGMYTTMSNREHAKFIALPYSTYGRFHAQTQKFVKDLATNASSCGLLKDSDPATQTAFVTEAVQELSCILQTRNAIIFNRGLKASRAFIWQRGHGRHGREPALHGGGGGS